MCGASDDHSSCHTHTHTLFIKTGNIPNSPDVLNIYESVCECVCVITAGSPTEAGCVQQVGGACEPACVCSHLRERNVTILLPSCI